MSVQELETPDAVGEKQVGYSIRPGYKQTEVGLIPVDWDVRRLAECATQITDGEHLTPDRAESGFYLLSARNVLNGRIDLSDVDYVGEDEFRRIQRRCNPDEGDILISCSGTIGRVAIVPAQLECVLVRSAALVKPNRVVMDGGFTHFFLQSVSGQSQIHSKVNQGAQPNLFLNHIEDLLIPLPPTLGEQEAIAEALGDADALVESLERLLAKKRNLKQAAMQQLLTGKKRLPGFEGEWEKKQIGSEIDLLTGFPFPSNSYADSGIRLLRGSNIKRGVTDWDEGITQFWPAITSDIKHYELRTGDIVIAMDGSLVGRSFAQLADSDLPALLLQRVARIRTETVSPNFLKAQICSPFFTAHCDSVKTVTAIPHISPKDIREYEMWIPPTIAEQSAIAEILSDMDSEIAAIESKVDKARQIKAGMMQELLTGKTRLV